MMGHGISLAERPRSVAGWCICDLVSGSRRARGRPCQAELKRII